MSGHDNIEAQIKYIVTDGRNATAFVELWVSVAYMNLNFP